MATMVVTVAATIPFSPSLWVGLLALSFLLIRWKWRPETVRIMMSLVLFFQVVAITLIMTPWTSLSLLNTDGVLSYTTTSLNVVTQLGTTGQLLQYALAGLSFALIAVAFNRLYRGR